MKKRNSFVMMLCALLVGGTMFACASDSGDDDNNNNNNNNNQEEDVYAMTAAPASLSIAAGDSDDITVTYKKNGSGIAGATIKAQSGNTKCFVVDEDTKESFTGNDGTATITINAKSVSEDCNGEVTIIDGNGKAQNRSVSVSVTANGGGGGGTETKDPELILIEPASGSIQLAAADAKANIVVEYRNAKGKPQADITIDVENSKDSCVRPVYGDIVTESNGQGTLPIKAIGSNCNSTITLSAGDASVDVLVAVGEPDDYAVRLEVNYLNEGSNDPNVIGMRHNDVKAITYGVNAGDSCPSDIDIIESQPSLRNPKGTIRELRQSNPVFTVKSYELSKSAGEVSIIAYAIDAEDNVIAGGCVDKVSGDKAGQTVTLNMHEAPIVFDEEYDVTANFDLLSSFEKTSDTYKAETMKAGDWVQFIIAFCNAPFNTLFDFIWDNSISRLADVEAIKNIGWIHDLIAGDGTKALARSALNDALKPTLEAQTWYRVINEVAPDISDLASNLQLRGTFKTGPYANHEMTGMQIAFDVLQYQWSLEFVGQDNCIDAPYGNSKCRRKMPLAKKGGQTIAGTCNATVELSTESGVDGYISFQVSDLTFKWATILYNAIFGEILPLALDYSSSSALQNGLYIKAFLEKILFTPVVNYYVANKQGQDTGKTKDDGTKITYPTLGSAEYCEKFVESLVYMIYADLAGWSSVIQTAATMVCSDGVIGQLDTLLVGAFDNIQANTSQGLVMKTADCPLYSSDNKFTEFGKPDSGATIPTAHDVFGAANKDSNRCKWDVGISSFKFDGLFHADNNSLN